MESRDYSNDDVESHLLRQILFFQLLLIAVIAGIQLEIRHLTRKTHNFNGFYCSYGFTSELPHR